MDIRIPKVARPSQNHFYLAKLPSYVKAKQTPFDGTLDEEFDEKDMEAFEHAGMQAENTIRWRYQDANSENKDSNARLVRWSDNSFSLLLGSELFGVSIKKKAQDHQYLVATHASERLWQTRGRFLHEMTFAPTSTNSGIHRKLTNSIRSRSKRFVKMKTISKIQDPEQMKREAEKVLYTANLFNPRLQMERESLKAKKKLATDQKKVWSRYDSAGYRDQSDSDGDRRPSRGMDYDTADFIDEDDEDDYRDRQISKSKNAPVEELEDSLSEEEVRQPPLSLPI
ncbi:Leo1-like protein-domain-containing protein [Chytridium lagenaria]|nr:Leo1-like protein-domain-containing protein [Chytridium lagenaria]